MELRETFTVPFPADRLWEVLTDVELISPCVPGFQLEEAEDPEYRGAMKVKVGAISMQYDAMIEFLERDDAARRAVLAIRGKERKGPGALTAKVTSTLIDKGTETMAEMVTEVQVTGRVAQFGRGILGDVSSRLTEQFVTCLNERVLAAPAPGIGSPAEQDVTASSRKPAPAAASHTEDSDSLDLGSVTVMPVLKRLAPAALAIGFVVALRMLLRRRSA
jgi:carbon monoxide dehydrogenase subunit G